MEWDSMLWGMLGGAKTYVNGSIHNLNFVAKNKILISKLTTGKKTYTSEIFCQKLL